MYAHYFDNLPGYGIAHSRVHRHNPYHPGCALALHNAPDQGSLAPLPCGTLTWGVHQLANKLEMKGCRAKAGCGAFVQRLDLVHCDLPTTLTLPPMPCRGLGHNQLTGTLPTSWVGMEWMKLL